MFAVVFAGLLSVVGGGWIDGRWYTISSGEEGGLTSDRRLRRLPFERISNSIS